MKVFKRGLYIINYGQGLRMKKMLMRSWKSVNASVILVGLLFAEDDFYIVRPHILGDESHPKNKCTLLGIIYSLLASSKWSFYFGLAEMSSIHNFRSSSAVPLTVMPISWLITLQLPDIKVCWQQFVYFPWLLALLACQDLVNISTSLIYWWLWLWFDIASATTNSHLWQHS